MTKPVHIHIGSGSSNRKVKDAASMNQMDAARKEIEDLCRKINNAVSEEKGVVAASTFGKIASIANRMAQT